MEDAVVEPAGPVGELLAAVRIGFVEAVPELLAGLDRAQRRECLAALRELRKKLRDDWSQSGTEARGALLVAGAGCHPGPAGAATWLGGGDFGGRDWARHPVLHQVVEAQPREWQVVVAALAGETPPRRLWDFLSGTGRSPLRGARTSVHGAVLAVRLEEAAWLVTAHRPPYLLATPTDATGAIEAAALVDRLAGYETAGVTPGRADLCAALLRVVPSAEPEVRAAAGALGSPAGRWLAHWLRTGGLPGQPSERVLFAPGRGGKRSRVYPDRWWEDVQRIAVAQPGIGAGPEGPAGERLAGEFRKLLDPTEPSVSRARAADDWVWRPIPHWAAMLPHHREELAARWLDHFAMGADRDERGAGRFLPLLAESGGPAGLALHLAVGYGLGARHTEDRTGAVDALLVLAGRGQLDGGLLGRELGELVARGTVKPARLVAALGQAAGTGAYGTVWSVLRAAVPGLLGAADPSARGLGDLLALATDCARRTKARGPLAEVTAAAGRGGSGRVAKEARALRDVLAD